jgi:hypothetical protein
MIYISRILEIDTDFHKDLENSNYLDFNLRFGLLIIILLLDIY